MGSLHNIPWFTGLVFLGFILDWSAVAFSWKTIKLFSKSLAMFLVILWTIYASGWQLRPDISLLLFGQIFGLIGDIFLQLPRRWFKRGLGAFLIGHVCYIMLLFMKLTEIYKQGDQPPYWVWLFLLGLVIFFGVMVLFYSFLSPISSQKSTKPGFWPAVQIYASFLALLATMAFLIILLLRARSILVWLLPTGAVLFLISDFLLSYRRFIKSIPHGQLWVRITYHLAQFSLAVGFLSVIF